MARKLFLAQICDKHDDKLEQRAHIDQDSWFMERYHLPSLNPYQNNSRVTSSVRMRRFTTEGGFGWLSFQLTCRINSSVASIRCATERMFRRLYVDFFFHCSERYIVECAHSHSFRLASFGSIMIVKRNAKLFILLHINTAIRRLRRINKWPMI